jgi:hypothetical protein
MFDMQNRTFGPHLAAINRILNSYYMDRLQVSQGALVSGTALVRVFVTLRIMRALHFYYELPATMTWVKAKLTRQKAVDSKSQETLIAKKLTRAITHWVGV